MQSPNCGGRTLGAKPIMDSLCRAQIAWPRLMLAAFVAPALASCLTLDGFLFAPTQAAADADLFADTEIPPNLRHELRQEIVTDDGVAVSAWLLAHDGNAALDPTPKARHRTGILFCHGNNQNLARFAWRAQALWSMGYTVLAFDYRGYGKTLGEPSELGTYADARAARAWLSRADGGKIDADRIALVGYSLGAAVCSQLAVEAPTQALVLEAPFASVAQLVQDNGALPLPREGLIEAVYDTRGKIGGFAGDLLVMHGEADTYVMPRYGLQVVDAATGARQRRWVPVPGADHETVPCAIKGGRDPVPGRCLGGLDANYTSWVTTAVDGAITPD